MAHVVYLPRLGSASSRHACCIQIRTRDREQPLHSVVCTAVLLFSILPEVNTYARDTTPRSSFSLVFHFPRGSKPRVSSRHATAVLTTNQSNEAAMAVLVSSALSS